MEAKAVRSQGLETEGPAPEARNRAGRNYAAQVAIVKEMTGRNRAAQLEIVKQMSRQ